MQKSLRFSGLLLGSAILFSACIPGLQQTTPTSSQPEPEQNSVEENENSPGETVEESKTVTYSLEEVAAHAEPTDCWLAIEGKVYDVTEYIAGGLHPGKEAILAGCGKDATELFNERPNGSGPHSQQARGFLPNFEIGVLAE